MYSNMRTVCFAVSVVAALVMAAGTLATPLDDYVNAPGTQIYAQIEALNVNRCAFPRARGVHLHSHSDQLWQHNVALFRNKITYFHVYTLLPDPTYKWHLNSTFRGDLGYTAYIIDLTSQTWLTVRCPLLVHAEL